MPTSEQAWRIVTDERWVEILALKKRIRALEAGLRHLYVHEDLTPDKAKCIAKALLRGEP
jgi:hypothetical protein